MANPQVEHGHIRIANELDEAIIVAKFNATQEKIVRCIMRLTFGWKRRTVRISQVELAEKCALSAASGSWRQAFALLLKHSVVVEVEPPIGRKPGAYALNKNFERWGKYSVPRGFIESMFRDRPDHVDNVPRAIARLRARSTESPQEDMDFGAGGGETDDSQDDSQDDRSMSSGGQSTDENEARSLSSDGQSTNRRLSSGGGLTVHQRRSDRPPEDSLISPKPNGTNAIGGGESNRKQLKTSSRKERAAAAAAGSPEPDVEKPGSTEYESGIVNAAVGACRRRWPDRSLSVAHATDLALEFMAAGIPADFACDAIRRAAARKLGKCPASIAWFRSRVTDLWRDRAHEIDKHGTDNGEQKPRAKAKKASELKDVINAELDPRLEAHQRDYTAARKAAGIAWAKDPANAADYRAILTAANARFDADTLKQKWGQSARDMDVLNRCAEACPFPAFDHWLAERVGNER